MLYLLLACPRESAHVNSGLKRLVHLCTMPVADMKRAFKFEAGQVWKLGTPNHLFDIYIRQAYVEALPVINRYIDLEGDATSTTRCMVRGKPGIGNTRFVWVRIVGYILAIKEGRLDAMTLHLADMNEHPVTATRANLARDVVPDNTVHVYDLETRNRGVPPQVITDHAFHLDINLSAEGERLHGITSCADHVVAMPRFTLDEARLVASSIRPAPIEGWEMSFLLLDGTVRLPFVEPYASLKRKHDNPRW